MKESHGAQPSGYEELMPWADPYIVALIEKLRGTDEFVHWGDDESDQFEDEVHDHHPPRSFRPRAELPPPSPEDDARDMRRWEADWSPKNWPRN